MRAVLLPLLVLAAGCAVLAPGTDPAGQGGRGAVLEAPLPVAWQALPAVYDSLALPVTFSDSAATRLAAVYAVDLWLPVVGPRRAPYARCSVPALHRAATAAARNGRGLNGVPIRVPPGRVLVTVETTLSRAGTGTRVSTSLRASPVALETGPAPAAPYCVSTGRLEAQIRRALGARAEAPTPDSST